jgi:hypothetical protein
MAEERVAETAEVAQIALMIERAGIRLSAAEVAALVEPFRRNRAALEAVRAELRLEDEPATTFRA